MRHSITAVSHDCDVLVIGSGAAGYCAAIQAGRSGCKTILVEKDSVLGGNSGPLLGVGITGADRYAHYAAETGIIHEIQEEGAWVDAWGVVRSGAYTISRRFEALVQSTLEGAGVRVLKRHYAREPVMDGNRITGVIVEDLAGFQTATIHVKHVMVEASGDGEVAFRAGGDFDMGSESREETGERSAPSVRSNLVQGTSLVVIAVNGERPVRFTPPPGTPPMRARLFEGSLHNALHHSHDGWAGNRSLTPFFLYVTEAGGDQDTVRDDDAIYERLLKLLWAEWDHVKNGPHADAARNLDILWISPKGGKRESRRFLGDYLLTQTDLESGRRFDDDIAYGGHNLDDHRPLPGGYTNIHGFSIPPLYGIPFRSCYSRNLDNVLLAGRLISASHLAHSSVRVIRTGAAVGQAVGLAAALCCRHQCTPREVGGSHLSELQDALLRHGASILNRPLPAQQDLARDAAVSASSEWRFNDVRNGVPLPLSNRVGNLLYDWPERLEAAEFYLRNLSDRPQPVRLRVWRSREPRRWRPSEGWYFDTRKEIDAAGLVELASVDVSISPGYESWRRIALDPALPLAAKDPSSDDDFLMVGLDASPWLEFSAAEHSSELMELWEYEEGSCHWRNLQAAGAMRLYPAPRVGEAVQLVDGFARRFSTAPTHMWMSDPEAGLPQEAVLTWPRAQRFGRIELAFDNLARTMLDNPWEHGPRVRPYLVRDYALDVWEGDGWREIVNERENFRRFRAHVFPAVTTGKLRLRVFAAHGEGHGVRVYSVAVY